MGIDYSPHPPLDHGIIILSICITYYPIVLAEVA